MELKRDRTENRRRWGAVASAKTITVSSGIEASEKKEKSCSPGSAGGDIVMEAKVIEI